jgi:hypothetical protein
MFSVNIGRHCVALNTSLTNDFTFIASCFMINHNFISACVGLTDEYKFGHEHLDYFDFAKIELTLLTFPRIEVWKGT